MKRGRKSLTQNYWPGFVDSLAAIIVVIIFLLIIFVIAQMFLTDTLSTKDRDLNFLKQDILELTESLNIEKEKNINLNFEINNVKSLLESSKEENSSLELKLINIDKAFNLLKNESQIDKEKLRSNLIEFEKLRQDITFLENIKLELEKKVSSLSISVSDSLKEINKLKSQNLKMDEVIFETKKIVEKLEKRSISLNAEIANKKLENQLLNNTLSEKNIEFSTLEKNYLLNRKKLKVSEELNTKNNNSISMLNNQVLALRAQLEALQNSLDQAEKEDKKQKVIISNLGKKLNRALAQKVEELSKYRSEFFGQLRKIISNRNDIQIVGDRFVLQSEVLFASGSAKLEEKGKEKLIDVANTLLEIIPKIPNNIDWILRVDGHTDAQPINNSLFPSNWELSTARANNVTKFLIRAGIPAQNIASAGFAEFQPIDKGNDEISYRRNRRIEFKLTGR
ncbi:peptidoglycan -binding protein [Alphaproteobacteria bacterium]|nr:peptidoglycan -binding protein [Alphaproteobacteria bacterium]